MLTLVLLAAGLLLAGSVLSSCGHRPAGGPAGRVQTPPAPSEPQKVARVIRVRLLDQADPVRLHTTQGYALTADGQAVRAGQGALPASTLARKEGRWTLDGAELAGHTLELRCPGGAIGLNGRTYHGTLILRPAAGDTLSADNHVELELYLAGVLARELYPNWHIEAFKALAVAARSYAVYEMQHAGRLREYDVFADQRSQVYGGIADETPKSLQAVRETEGLVLAHGPTDGSLVVKAYYSSCCGGMTNPADWLEPQPAPAEPLAGGVVCTDCQAAPRYRWADVSIRKADVVSALARVYPTVAAMGPIHDIRVCELSQWNRPVRVELLGQGRTGVRLRADDIRVALLRAGVPDARRLYSMNCTLVDEGPTLRFAAGRGFGHSVGLCQWGAQGKALRGVPYHEILYTYYPGARIMKAY